PPDVHRPDQDLLHAAGPARADRQWRQGDSRACVTRPASMKTIEVSPSAPTLVEVLDLAGEDNVILRTPEGRQFLLAEIDDFADEVAKVVQNESLMQLLAERSSDTSRVPLSQVREELQGKKRSQGKQRGK